MEICAAILVFILNIYGYEIYYKRYKRYINFRETFLTYIMKYGKEIACPFVFGSAGYESERENYIKAQNDLSKLADELLGFSEVIPKPKLMFPASQDIFDAAKEIKNVSQLIYNENKHITRESKHSIRESISIASIKLRLDAGEITIGSEMQ